MSASASPRLAWELIERIISLSGDDRRTLRSFSLTCHQLRPRSLCLMIADVAIMERAQVVAFRDFLEAYPHFCPFVYSIIADPTTFMPFPLLRILPNLTITQWFTAPTPERTLLLPFGFLRTRFGRKALWSEELGKYFPELTERGLLKIFSSADVALGHDEWVSSLIYSPDGSRLATASLDCTIILWDSDGQFVHEWVAHTGSVRSLAFSPDSRHLASGGDDKKIVVWDVSQGARRIATLEGHTQSVNRCIWSPDGTLIASRSRDNTARLWDARAFQQLHVLDVSTNILVHDVYFSSDGRWLISTGSRRCYVWDIVGGTMHKDFYIAKGEDIGDQVMIDAEKEKDNDEEDKGEKDEEDKDADVECWATALNVQGTRLATGYLDGSVRIWDVQTGQCPFVSSSMHLERVTGVAFSSDGARLLSTAMDKTVKVWDASSGAMILSFEGHTNEMLAACFSPCGKYVASASFDQKVRLWRTDDGSCMGTFSEHKSMVSGVTFSPDGKTLSSGA
ncbi:quinon protein alcohol dehydrogenase-like superfamily [Dichomitus squalens]|nr:quinon protein alcohol dehydrogenase-like superfamily [Dichomitus squalens]